METVSESSNFSTESTNANVLNLKTTELRLGLPGFGNNFDENKGKIVSNKNAVSGGKRVFSDVDRCRNWEFNGGSVAEVNKGLCSSSSFASVNAVNPSITRGLGNDFAESGCKVVGGKRGFCDVDGYRNWGFNRGSETELNKRLSASGSFASASDSNPVTGVKHVEDKKKASDTARKWSSFMKEFDEWEARVFELDLQIDRLIEDRLINMMLRDQHRRAKRRYYDREREKGEARLMEDYFVDNPTYGQEIFQCRFRMRKPLFLTIVEVVTAYNEYFHQRPDATGRQGLSPLQKCTGAIRMLAYGASGNAFDEYLKMSESVTRKTLMNFVESVITCFGDEYLRKPDEDDLASLLCIGEQRGFPGMIGSIDCMHWKWKNCPTTWSGQYAKSGKPTIILEVVASYDLWIWHACFGTPGSLSGINVFQQSPFFSDILAGEAPKANYVVNGRKNDTTYYLTDYKYPPWAAFIKPIIAPQIQKDKLFTQHQKTVRKDAERAFKVLQDRFTFLRRPCLIWDKHKMGRIMLACIIMHNMIIEDERETYQKYYDPIEFFNGRPTNQQPRHSTKDDDQPFEYSTERIADLSCDMTNREHLRNRKAHTSLEIYLIEHICQKFGTNS